MNSERIREIQAATPYPESHSIAAALHQVWNECAQAKASESVKNGSSNDECKEGSQPEHNVAWADDPEPTIFEKVKANQAILKACTYHDFDQPVDRVSKLPLDKIKFGCKWKCSRCGGIVDTSAKTWYENGIIHQKEYENGERTDDGRTAQN